MFLLLYGIIIFCATLFGAFVGLGGGVIIKPLLDLIGHDTISVVNFVSSCAVFSMSISSTIKHIISKTRIDFKLIIKISIGAIIGGICGARLFDYLLSIFDNEVLKGIQGVILGLLLLASVIYINLKNRKSFNVKNSILTILIGFGMGLIAAFLGVGGGPINVAVLVLFFSLSMKEAAVYSVGTIFFSQLSNIITTAATGNLPKVSIVTIIVAICCAVCGGLVGARVNKASNEKVIKIVFTVMVAGIAIVNFVNGFNGIF